MVATIVCCVELAEALKADGQIGSQEDVLIVSGVAWLDGKRGVMSERLCLSLNPLDAGERWGLGDQRPEEVFNASGITLDIDHHARGVVPYTPA